MSVQAINVDAITLTQKFSMNFLINKLNFDCAPFVNESKSTRVLL